MEKISGIVRGNQRMTAVDTKSASAARPGGPSFGRPVGESTAGKADKTSTASRAAALHNGMTELKKAYSEQRVIQQMADEFFMNKMRAPEHMPSVHAPAQDSQDVDVEVPEMSAADREDMTEVPEEEIAEAKQFVPRGSFVDVRA